MADRVAVNFSTTDAAFIAARAVTDQAERQGAEGAHGYASATYAVALEMWNAMGAASMVAHVRRKMETHRAAPLAAAA